MPLNDLVESKRKKNGVEIGKLWGIDVTQLFHDAVSMKYFDSNPTTRAQRLNHL
jgi:arginyl-tRNA--protein-N-Asp/Glu arginylyltransferase